MSDLLLPLTLPADVTSRGATMDDVAAAVAVIQAAERADGVESVSVHDDIASDWARPSMDITNDVLLVEANGQVVAYAEQFNGRAFAHVHPDQQGRGIGTAVAAWTEEHARRAGLSQVGQTISTRGTASRALLEGRGYDARWDSWILKMSLDTPPPAPRVPDGITIRDLRRPDDDRAVHAVIEEAFDTWPDREAGTTFDDWRVSYLERATDTGLVVVAEEGGRLVGVALCIPEDGEGWVDQLAVLPSAWGRGIGGALLQAAFQRFRDQGRRRPDHRAPARSACTSTWACRSRSPSRGTRWSSERDHRPPPTGRAPGPAWLRTGGHRLSTRNHR